jgi:hypothetical protein
MLIATSTQMLSAVQNQVLRCLMGDMLNGRAPVYFGSDSLYSIVLVFLLWVVFYSTALSGGASHTRGARARLAAPGRGATRGGVERAERKERKEEGHPFPPGEWGGIRGVSGVPSRSSATLLGRGPRPSGQG